MQGKYHLTADGTSYTADMDPGAIRALENARAGGWNVRIFMGDAQTGKAWAEEWDVFGRVSRTMGNGQANAVKAAMLVAPRAHGGSPFTSSIVAVLNGPGRFAYKHPAFDPGTFEKRTGTEGYAVDVYKDGELQSRHRSQDQADRYVAFMTGNRMTK